jgi:cholesterol transport system auxiliary component
MSMAKSTIFQRVMVPGLLALSLGACVSFGAKAPPSMLVLTSTSSVTSGTIRSAAANEALVVLMPQTPRKLDTNRLPVQIDDSSIAYLKDAVWADKPARLMQLLLMETIASKSGRLVLNEVDTGGKGQQFLSGSLLEFGVDAASTEAVVVYDAVKLVRGQVVEKRRFEAKKSITAMEAATVGAALNDAANDVAGQIADWIG